MLSAANPMSSETNAQKAPQALNASGLALGLPGSPLSPPDRSNRNFGPGSKVTGRTDIHNLYSPKSRRQQFLRADWRFLIRTSANIARAFAVVHETGCVIGDVNH